jgi:hypothetical protein
MRKWDFTGSMVINVAINETIREVYFPGPHEESPLPYIS